jgi:putative endopeptidase
MNVLKTVIPALVALLPLALAPTACGGAEPAPATVPAVPSSAPSASTPVASATASYPTPKLGTFGVDTASMDTGTRPGADFDAYVNGLWKKSASIPSDRSRWGMFDQLREEADANVRAILEEAAKSNGDKGSNAQKMGDFYSAYLDTATIDAKGLAPAKAELDRIAAARTLEDVARLMGSPELSTNGPVGAGVSLDQKDPDHYIVRIGHSGLGLPEREYYLKTEAQFVEIRAKYLAHLKRLLELGGDRKASADADAILALETKIADRHWPIADRRERDKTYNPRTLVELQKDAPEFPWKAFLSAGGYAGESKYIVAEVSAIPKLAKLFKETPVATWKAYLTYHLLRASADVLPSALDKEVFDFYDHTLNGQPEQRERWKRGVAAVNGALGEAVGEIYVARNFQPRAKAAMDQLIENLRKAYASRIEGVDWMTPDTKRVALEKLAAFRPKIGYPVKWKSYATLDVQPGDAFGNGVRAAVWRHDYDLARLGKPSDRDEWRMTPQTVNAYYNPVFNEIVFPAAILQPPFFDPDADPAVNYGGIGGVIGHEMGHGFDDQGSKSDARGVLRTWWSQADIDAFKKRTGTLADQYSAFEPLPGIKVNGRLTLGENIGDVGGLNVSYRAYQLSLGGQPAAVRDGFTGDQRFFLGWAQVWREVIRDQALRNLVMTNPHSPSIYRVNGVVRNLDAWYAAFDVKPEDPLYLAPESRVRIW